MEKKLTPLAELIEYLNDNNHIAGNELSLPKLDEKITELLETEKQMVVDAFKAGRVAGAIFKKQEDNEGLSGNYFTETYKQQ